MIRSPEIDKLAASLAKAQGLIEDADKDSTNPHFRSKYSDFASIRAVVRKPLSDNALAYVQLPRTVEKGVEVETILMHESGQMIGETLFMPAPGMTAQAIGSALTYAKRYGLMAIVGLASSEDDDDGNAATRPVRHEPNKTPISKKGETTPFDEPERPPSDNPAIVGVWRNEVSLCASAADLDALWRTEECKTARKNMNSNDLEKVKALFSTAKATLSSRVAA